ncbi:MAG: RcsF lipoprotein [Fibrobacteria bacterium]|jgi:hypothetical protein|nr:RcsF lipoprotein [Fibrobacteria bacterium]
MKKISSVMIAGLLLAACASTPSYRDLTPAQREKYERVDVVEGPVKRRHETLGRVEAVSCRRNLYFGSATEDEAREGVRVKATRRDADAVKQLTCRREGISLSRNCWASVICAGWAIRFDPTDSSSSQGW